MGKRKDSERGEFVNVHKDHRERLRSQLLAGGVESCHEHQILEFFLFPFTPQKDTNVIAHELINRFGSLSAVFGASFEELREVKNVTATAAANISLFHGIAARINFDKVKKNDILDSVGAVYRYISGFTENLNAEHCYLICLDGSLRVVKRQLMQKGIVCQTAIYLRQIAELAILNHAVHILVIHNHPSGNLRPSEADWEATREMFRVFPALQIHLLDHIIVGRGEYYSFRDSDEFWELRNGVAPVFSKDLNDAFLDWDK
jgi:DNA repair protein RadC